jgi:hypothetical protein
MPMPKETADELVAAIMTYKLHPNTRDAMAWAIPQRGGYIVLTHLGEQFAAVPERLVLTKNPCTCTARWCASGKVAPGLLAQVRGGRKVIDIFNDAPEEPFELCPNCSDPFHEGSLVCRRCGCIRPTGSKVWAKG